MKKALQLCFCSLALILGLSSATFAANFVDVPTDAWYAPYVNDLVDRGIVNGVTSTTFAPDATVTRAEFVKILACTSGENLSAYNCSSKFTDCSTHWAKQYINWATDKNIVNGISETQYAPNGNITREQMATIIGRYLIYKSIKLEPIQSEINFTDNDSISGYAAPYVSLMQQVGIISGEKKGDGYAFKPRENALRSAAAKMISCLIENIGIYNRNQYQEQYQLLTNNYNINMTTVESELELLQSEYTNTNEIILNAQAALSELPGTMDAFLSARMAYYFENHIYLNSYQAALAAKSDWDQYYAQQVSALNSTISTNQSKLTKISSDISIKKQEITDLTNQYNNDVANLKNKYNIE